MLSSTLIIAVSALASLASAQNYTTSGPLNITASQIPIAMRQIWCNAQQVSCPEICGGQAFPNHCNPNDLSYVCVCTDGSHPNISAYQQTVPFYVCEQWKTNCVANHPNDLVGQAGCHSVTCGMKNASLAESGGSGGSSSSSAAPSASSSGGSGGGSGGSGSGGSASSTTSKGFAAATHIASNYGTQILAGGMLAAFGLAL